METSFGIYINDKLKLINHRALLKGVRHRHNISPLDPKPGEDVTIQVTTDSGMAFERVALYYTTDGTAPIGSRGVATNGTALEFKERIVEWDSLAWGFVVCWKAVIPAQSEGTMVQYVISAWSDEGSEVCADSPNFDDERQHACMIHFKNIPQNSVWVDTGQFPYENVFNYHVDNFEPPTWADSAVIYHIFVDRFYPGDSKTWQQTANLDDFCGGTLWGVHDKLDYLADLGINCIWLSPTWTSPTHHGYDITDYKHVEPRLGGDNALRAVVEGAHQRGIRILLDMACNHISNQHPIFLEAQSDENSPYRDWFFFNDQSILGYKAFFNVAGMPRINLDVPAARDWMIANAVLWLRDFDVDGYRLDVADGPGPNFWNYFRKACRAVKSDCLLFGEVVDIPHRLRTYAGRLDGCLDFPLVEAMRHTFALESLTEAQFEAFAADNSAYYPGNFVRPTFLDNHDMNRFSYLAANDVAKLKRAAIRQFQLPGPHIIYYGTEVDVPQDKTIQEGGFSVSRGLMLWDENQNQDLFRFYKQLIQEYKKRQTQ